MRVQSKYICRGGSRPARLPRHCEGGDAPAGNSCTVWSVSFHPLGSLGIATFQKEQAFWLSRHCEGSLLPVAISLDRSLVSAWLRFCKKPSSHPCHCETSPQTGRGNPLPMVTYCEFHTPLPPSRREARVRGKHDGKRIATSLRSSQ